MRKINFINSLTLFGMVSCWALLAPAQTAPPNDYFTNRIALTNLQNSVRADNSLASFEPGEPLIGNFDLGRRTLWWSFTAPKKGALFVFVDAPTFAAVWGIFRGQELTNLSLVSGDWGPKWMSMDLEPYEEVQIAVDGAFGAAGPFTLQTIFYPQATNDMFTNAIRLEGTNLLVAANNASATVEPGEPPLTYGSAGRTVWYSWVAPTNGKVSVDTPWLISVLCVYEGDAIDQLRLVKTRQFSLSFQAIEGHVYSLRVDGQSGGGAFQLSLNLVPCATVPNDDFTNAYDLAGAVWPYAEWITLATMEPGEPAHLDGRPCKSLWWKWEAPTNGKLDLWSSVSQVPDLTLAVYTGSAVDALTLVAKGTNRVILNVECRTVYHVAVVAEQSATGEIGLCSDLGPNSSPVVVPGNLLCDSSFETAQPECWQVVGPNATWCYPGAMDASFFMGLANRTKIYQDVPTVPGRPYRLRFAYSACANGAAGAHATVKWDAKLLGAVIVPLGQESLWNWVEYVVTASNDVSRITFENPASIGVGTFCIDATSVICLNEAPSVTATPVSRSSVEGGTVAFEVAAKGSWPLAYQWLFDASPIPGATNRLLVLSLITTNDAGLYSVVVTNAFGSITSPPARLAVEAPKEPTLVLQPYGDIIPVGSYFSLSAAAVGGLPLSYQWFKDSALMPGATDRQLVFVSFQSTNSGTYVVSVSNELGSVWSVPATLVGTTTNQGGGLVLVANRFGEFGERDVPVFDLDSVTKLSGSNYLAQLYIGPSIESLRPEGSPRPFLTGFDSGVFVGEYVTLSTVAPRTLAAAQIRVWDRTFGMSYGEARALGGKFGRSPIFWVVPGGSVPGMPPFSPAPLDNLRSFSLQAGSPGFNVGRIEFAGQQPDGALRWAVVGNAGYRYLVEKSTNTVWRPLVLLTNITGTSTFTDTPQAGSAFYRARILE